MSARADGSAPLEAFQYGMAALHASSPLGTSHATLQRGPNAGAALAAGLVAGTAALALMQFTAMVAYDESPWKLPRMIAALVGGPGWLADEDTFASPVLFGFALHYTLSLLYALALAGILAGQHREHAPIVGLLFGAALYVANLHAFTALFPWFAPMRTLDTLVAHAVFGIVAACAYCEFSRPKVDQDNESS
jgi:hypothetical protein